MLRQNADRVGCLEWWLAHDALVHDRADRIDVAPPIEFVSLNLFGGHVVRRADDGATTGHLRFHRALEKLREPEVQHLGRLAIAALGDHDVLGLEVAVHDPRRVCILYGPRDLSAQIGNPSERHRPIFVEHLGEVVAIDILHDEIERARLRAPEVEHMNRVWVIEARRRLGLAVKPSHILGVLLELSVQQLDRHHLADLHMLRAIHGPHGPAPYRCHHAIPVGNDVTRLENSSSQGRAALPTELRLGRVALPAFVAAHLVVWCRARHPTSKSGSQAKLPRE